VIRKFTLGGKYLGKIAEHTPFQSPFGASDDGRLYYLDHSCPLYIQYLDLSNGSATCLPGDLPDEFNNYGVSSATVLPNGKILAVGNFSLSYPATICQKREIAPGEFQDDCYQGPANFYYSSLLIDAGGHIEPLSPSQQPDYNCDESWLCRPVDTNAAGYTSYQTYMIAGGQLGPDGNYYFLGHYELYTDYQSVGSYSLFRYNPTSRQFEGLISSDDEEAMMAKYLRVDNHGDIYLMGDFEHVWGETAKPLVKKFTANGDYLATLIYAQSGSSEQGGLYIGANDDHLWLVGPDGDVIYANTGGGQYEYTVIKRFGEHIDKTDDDDTGDEPADHPEIILPPNTGWGKKIDS
jgi:hypothetical protein